MFSLQRDLIFIKNHSPFQSLRKLSQENVEIHEEDLKTLASVGRLAAAFFAVSIFFVSSSWITCGIVWILSHDLYSTACYVHDRESSPWQKDCTSHKMVLAFSKAWVSSWFGGSHNITDSAAQQLFWDGVKHNLISFKIYALIKKRLG